MSFSVTIRQITIYLRLDVVAFHFLDQPYQGQPHSLLLLVIPLTFGLYALINSSKAISDLPRNTIISFFSLFFLIIFGFPVLLISALGLAAFLKSIYSDYNQ